MKSVSFNAMIATGLILSAVLCLCWWFTREPAVQVGVSVPGMDDPLGHKKADAARRASQIIDFGAIYETFDGRAAAIEGEWPRFRGPDIDGIVKDGISLAGTFPESGPPRLWTLELGPGYAGAAVHAGRVFVLDHMLDRGDLLRCFSLADATELWRVGYPIRIANNHGISRTVPAVTEKYVVSIGPMGHVMCVDTDTGKPRWGIDLIREYGTRDLSSYWYAGQCPLVDGERAILAPVGTNVLMMAVDCASGEVVWRTPHTQGWKMSHSSIIPVTLHGTRMYVYVAVGGVAGVAADGPEAGRLLWETDDWSPSVAMPSPVPIGNNRIFLTSGYGGGSALLEIVSESGTFRAKTVYAYRSRSEARECFSSYQQTPILYQGHLFAIQSNDAREHRMEFVCVDPNVPGGKIVWSSGRDTVLSAPNRKEAWSPYILADGKFYVMGDAGLLAVFEATTAACRKLGQWQLLDGYETWGPLAVAGGRLLVRDMTRLVCFDIRVKGGD